MNRHERKLWFCFTIFILLFTFSSCSNSGGKDDIYSDRRHGYSFLFVARSEEGVFYVGEDELVHFSSSDTQEDTIICFDPTCEHEPASKLNPDPKCCAALFNAVTRIAYYEDNLYYFVQDGVFDTQIYRMSLDGGTRELVAEIPYSFEVIRGIVFEEDYVYYVAQINELPEDSFVVESYYELMEVNLNDGSYRLLTSGGKSDYSFINKFDVYGNILYAEVQLDNIEGPYNIVVDLGTLDMRIEAKNDEYREKMHIGVYDEESYYYCNINTAEIGIYNMTTGKKKRLMEVDADYYSSLLAFDREIFYKTGLDGDFKYFFYDVAEDELTDITDKCVEYNIWIYDGYSDIFIGYVFDETEEHDDGGRTVIGYRAYKLAEIVNN